MLHELVEIGWAAGFYDGEGSTTFSRSPASNGRTYPKLSVQITQYYNPETLERFREAVGGIGRVFGPYTHSNGKGGSKGPYWVYTATHQQAEDVLEQLLGFLSGPKREQATVAIKKREAARVYPRRARPERNPIAA